MALVAKAREALAIAERHRALSHHFLSSVRWVTGAPEQTHHRKAANLGDRRETWKPADAEDDGWRRRKPRGRFWVPQPSVIGY
jgi:hypothetical protein